MNKYEFKKLKKQVESIKTNKSIYLKLKDCVYKTIGAGKIEEVEEIPPNATVEIIPCDKKNFVYLFTANNKPYWTEIISVSESIRRGDLDGVE